MIELSISNDERDELKGDLRKYAKDIRRELEVEVARTTFAAERQAKIYAPVKTGLLRSSGRAIIKGLEGKVSFSAHYAVFQEFGTRFMRGRFFLTRAIEGQRVRFNQNIIKILNRVRRA